VIFELERPDGTEWSITKLQDPGYNKEFEADNGLVSGVDGRQQEKDEI
jgi:hypothetical protein